MDTITDALKGGGSKIGNVKDQGRTKIGSLSKKQAFKPTSYGGLKRTSFGPRQGASGKIKNAISKIKEKLSRKKKPQKEVTQYFSNSSNNIINYS